MDLEVAGGAAAGLAGEFEADADTEITAFRPTQPSCQSHQHRQPTNTPANLCAHYQTRLCQTSTGGPSAASFRRGLLRAWRARWWPALSSFEANRPTCQPTTLQPTSKPTSSDGHNQPVAVQPHIPTHLHDHPMAVQPHNVIHLPNNKHSRLPTRLGQASTGSRPARGLLRACW